MLENTPIRIIELLQLFVRDGYAASLDLSSHAEVWPDLQTDLHQCAYCFKGLVSDIEGDLLSHEMIYQRSQLMGLVHRDVSKLLEQQQIQLVSPSLINLLLWYYWLPLAQSLALRHNQLQRPLIQGLLGGQGTGKTTLGAILTIIFRHLGKSFRSISLDDFYKTYAERQKLRDRRPALIWRGPPSTHDINLCEQVLQQISNPQTRQITIPRFDKSLHCGAGDRIASESCDRPDITLFEGWFVGMRPLPISAFRKLIPPILSESDQQYALDCNAELDNYTKLWDYLDSLIVLIPEQYEYSLEWRIEAEHKLIANTNRQAMSDAEITEFVEYFWKALHPELFWPPLISPEYSCPSFKSLGADLVIRIARSHLPQRIYFPKHT
ncbi:MAG: glycerate kinase [Pseudanabaenaceae cyanobacterium bins.39]|nr:glycerate kinase [Pseudanabaenaceae cyanobacterium bins.39]